MQDMQEIDVGPKRPEVYRSGNEFVKALANQMEIPDSFFNEHNALERAVGNRDIQDPRVWVRAVVPSENAKPLNASLDSSSMYLHFSSKGEMPGNISAKSKSGEYINLLLAEAKFQAVQKVMPETYATGHWKVSKAIKEVRALRKAVVNSPGRFELSSLLSPSESGRVRLGMAVPLTLVSAGLILSACAPNVIVPSIPIADSIPDRSTLTQAAPSATETATPTETPIPAESLLPLEVKEKEVVVLNMFGGREYGHPIYKWDGAILMDVLYRPSVGYDYVEIETAFYAFVTQTCDGEGKPTCWHGQHVGLLKNTASTPPIVAGFYYNKSDGKYYLVDTDQCLLKDGCLEE